MTSSDTDQLETDQVFIDTQAWVRERLNWESKSCNRLRELVRSGHIQVLTTSVTRSEVLGKIREGLEHARSAARKHDVVLSQLGSADASATLNAPEAESKLLSLFDAFMDDVKAVEVPISKNVDRIFDDYFHGKPPFSAKKKSEFPDAFVVASLRERAQLVGKNVYVVSEDPDLRACCAHAPELVIVDGLPDIISKATVTKALHDSLLSFLKGSEYLEDKLIECLTQSDVSVLGGSRPDVRISLEAGGVNEVDEILLTGLNVISQQGNRFLCDVEFQAVLDVWLDFGVETHYWDGEEDHEGSDEFSTRVADWGFHNAEVELEFDVNDPEKTVFNSIRCSADIEIDASLIDEFKRYYR